MNQVNTAEVLGMSLVTHLKLPDGGIVLPSLLVEASKEMEEVGVGNGKGEGLVKSTVTLRSRNSNENSLS